MTTGIELFAVSGVPVGIGGRKDPVFTDGAAIFGAGGVARTPIARARGLIRDHLITPVSTRFAVARDTDVRVVFLSQELRERYAACSGCPLESPAAPCVLQQGDLEFFAIDRTELQALQQRWLGPLLQALEARLAKEFPRWTAWRDDVDVGSALLMADDVTAPCVRLATLYGAAALLSGHEDWLDRIYGARLAMWVAQGSRPSAETWAATVRKIAFEALDHRLTPVINAPGNPLAARLAAVVNLGRPTSLGGWASGDAELRERAVNRLIELSKQAVERAGEKDEDWCVAASLVQGAAAIVDWRRIGEDDAGSNPLVEMVGKRIADQRNAARAIRGRSAKHFAETMAELHGMREPESFIDDLRLAASTGATPYHPS